MRASVGHVAFAPASVITDHSDIRKSVFADFIHQLYDEPLPEAVEYGAAGPSRKGVMP